MRPVVVVVLAALLGACGESAPEVDVAAPPSTTTTAEPEAAGSATTASTSTAPPAPPGRRAGVVRVIDGDTLEVTGGERVRLIGVDTPETKDPRRPVQCFGREAAARTAELLGPGTEVRLVDDVERLDDFGRTLAYVYRLADGLFVNAALVADGYAVPATYPPNVAHAEELARLAGEAREAGRGLWAACGDGPAPAATAPSRPPVGACEPSYPDACIPPAPPDLDCPDVAARRFRVLPPDPHRFDANQDGVGCESG